MESFTENPSYFSQIPQADLDDMKFPRVLLCCNTWMLCIFDLFLKPPCKKHPPAKALRFNHICIRAICLSHFLFLCKREMAWFQTRKQVKTNRNTAVLKIFYEFPTMSSNVLIFKTRIAWEAIYTASVSCIEHLLCGAVSYARIKCQKCKWPDF